MCIGVLQIEGFRELRTLEVTDSEVEAVPAPDGSVEVGRREEELGESLVDLTVFTEPSDSSPSDSYLEAIGVDVSNSLPLTQGH